MRTGTDQHANGTVREAAASSLVKPHVAVLFDRLGPYHHARLRAAGSRLRVTGIEYSNVDTTYAWDVVEEVDGFKKLTLFPETPVKKLSAGHIFSRDHKQIRQEV